MGFTPELSISPNLVKSKKVGTVLILDALGVKGIWHGKQESEIDKIVGDCEEMLDSFRGMVNQVNDAFSEDGEKLKFEIASFSDSIIVMGYFTKRAFDDIEIADSI